jgi:uncharacterized membrane protein
MKIWPRLVVLAFLLLTHISFLWPKSYRIEEMAIEGTLSSAGTLEISERIRYNFDGSFSYAFREIPTLPGERIENVRISDETGQYRQDSGEAPGSFAVASSDAGTTITWYFEAHNERRAFNVTYVVQGVVRRYADVAELYYKFVGEGWDRSIDTVSVVVRLMEGVPAGSIRAWAHGPFHGSVSLPGDGTVRFAIAPLPAHTFWEGRILFPADQVSQMPAFSNEPALERILAEESDWANAANRLREEAVEAERRRSEWAEVLLPVAILAPLAGIGVWILLFGRFGRPYPKAREFVPGELPSTHPPALVSYLLYHRIGGTAVVATLIDLARRGHLRIREEVKETRGWFGSKVVTDYRFELTGQSERELVPFEQQLLDFMVEQGGDAAGFWLSELKKASQVNRSRLLKWFKEWNKGVESLGKDLQFWESYRLGVLLLNIGGGLLVAGAGIAISVVTESPLGLPALGVGALQAILSVQLTRRTREGQQLYEAWNGFKKHLKSVSRSKGPLSLTSSEWGEYIVSATLFGMHGRLKKLLELSPGGETAPLFPWYVPGGSGHGQSSFAGLGTGISSMVSSVSSTVSSASGLGGGASAGGGGGSGGGGGGAG